MKVIWAPRAIARAAEMAEYIAADRPAAAEGWVERLFAKAATLARHARRGRKVPELDRDDVRQVNYGKYRIIYRIDPKRVVVLTVRHNRRQWDLKEVVGLCPGRRLLTVQIPRKPASGSLAGHADCEGNSRGSRCSRGA